MYLMLPTKEVLVFSIFKETKKRKMSIKRLFAINDKN